MISFGLGRKRIAFLIPYFLIIAFYAIAILPAPGRPIPQGIYDEGLFFRWSTSLLHGQWLGPWDELTTSKGPLHSILTAFGFQTGLHVYAFRRLMYLLASVVFAFTAFTKSRHWVRILVLTALLTDPFQFGEGGLRNLREGTYIPLQMIGFGLGVLGLDMLREERRFSKKLFAVTAAMAFSFGLLMVTREARSIVWMELLLWLVLVCCLCLRSLSHARKKWLSILACVVIVYAGAMAPIQALRIAHLQAYGAPISNSLEEGSFPRLYGKLVSARLIGEEAKPRVPLSKKTMTILIEESGNHGGKVAAILQGFNPKWSGIGCSMYLETCGEYAGGWLQWALRESISSQLVSPKNERAFQEYATSAANEVAAICRTSSRLSCDPRAESYFLPMHRWGFKHPFAEVLNEASKVLGLTLVPRLYPQGKPNYYAFNKWPPPLFSQLGLSPLGTNAITINESFKWTKGTVVACFVGVALKVCLLVLVIALLSRAMLHFPSSLTGLDLPSLWLFGALVIHLSVYTLLGLTSFSGSLYVVMASPIYIACMGRFIGASVGRSQC
jgi:hypothetical protein